MWAVSFECRESLAPRVAVLSLDESSLGVLICR